ncbi:proton-conducting transporter membrane subunit [Streptomyces sp. NPDC006422]|uniref:complex I subunit 5 family protein n=1 Tax=unclassified Streptomyces TaxID=2593676 RepID=UPI0033A9B0C0
MGAALLVAAGSRLPRRAADTLAVAVAALEVGVLALLWTRTGGTGRAVSWVGGWRPRHGESVGIVLVGERIGIGIALLAAVLVLAVMAYSWRYFSEPPRRHGGVFPALVLLFEAGMCGFALTGDLFNAFVFFELMGVAACALTGYRIEDPRPLQGALTFGIANSIGAYLMLMGIGLLYARTGELGFAQIGQRLDTHHGGPDALVACAAALVVTGLLVKTAAVPFHFWLPDAHTVAPSPVCMLLSGVMVELGAYGVVRVHTVVFAGAGGVPTATYEALMVALGTVTALVGAVMCWQQRHIKRLLAFSTVAHSGLFLVGLAVLTPESAAGTAVYVAAHAGTKAALFGLAGVLVDRFGSVDERELHGRGRELPWVGAQFAFGGLLLAGLPPFGPGLGKALTEHAAAQSRPWILVVYVAVSAVTGGAVVRVALRVFWGVGEAPPPGPGEEISGGDEEPETDEPARRVPAPMHVVPALLLAGAAAWGLVPGAAHALGEAATVFADRAGYVSAVLGTGPAPPHLLPVPETAWTVPGVLLGVASTGCALALAGSAVRSPGWGPRRLLRPLVRLHSGRPGDQVAWLVTGAALIAMIFVAAV